MAMGRGSATANKFTMNMVLALLLLCFLLGTQVVESATYTVGDKGGWGFNSGSWTKGKRFKAGDVLVFNYNPSIHNVVSVNAAGYNSCKTPRGAKVLTSGSDRITLAKGTNYFICNFSGHCESGMKIAVTAA